MPRLLISAAHTMESPGAIYQDLKEADLTRKMLQKTVAHLERLKVDFKAVPLDLPLMQRIDWINNSGFHEDTGDIFVEIHINDGGKRGIESWFKGAAGPDNNSQKLAEYLLDKACTKTGYLSQKAKSEYEHELGALLILNQANPIGTAIEFLYIDNPEDIAILKNDQKLDDLCRALAESIQSYFQEVKITPKAKAQEVLPGFQNTVSPAPLFPTMTTPAFPQPSSDPFRDSFSGGFNPSMPSFGGSMSGMRSAPTAGSSGMMMDREQRKEMIKKVYLKVLGKDPNQNDTNTYLNLGTSEEELLKKLLESKEHEDVVNDAKEAKQLKDKIAKVEGENMENKAKNADREAMMINLHKLLEHKNKYITELQNEMVKHKIISPGQYFDPNRKTIDKQDQSKIAKKKPKNTNERVMKFLKI